MKVSETIRNIMNESNLSQAQLANMIGVSQKAISNWLNGIDKPNATSLLIIYKNFGITPNEMLEIEDPIEERGDQQHSVDEQMLLRAYRSMTPGKKKALFQMLDLDENAIKQNKKA